uniref:Peptidase M14 domain-containing protein n=1 Tax=Timema poppense TaxID=170557 RepID=A0A7R9GXL3_TIMPO|nr:unnamed protein product [Timema poppensis]
MYQTWRGMQILHSQPFSNAWKYLICSSTCSFPLPLVLPLLPDISRPEVPLFPLISYPQKYTSLKASDFPSDSYLSEPMSPRASSITHNGDQNILVIQSDQPHRQFKSALPSVDDLIHSSQSFSTCVLHVRHEVALLIQHHVQVSGILASSYHPASGSSLDWVKGVLNVTFTFAFELRDNGTYGDLLPANLIIPSGEETLASKLYPHLRGTRVVKHFRKTTFSTRNRNSNLDLPVTDNLGYCESRALDHAATEVSQTDLILTLLQASFIVRLSMTKVRVDTKYRTTPTQTKMEWASFAYETDPFHSFCTVSYYPFGIGKVEYRGSEPKFAWRKSGKRFRKTTPSSPDRDLNLDLPVLGSLAQHTTMCGSDLCVGGLDPSVDVWILDALCLCYLCVGGICLKHTHNGLYMTYPLPFSSLVNSISIHFPNANPNHALYELAKDKKV